MVAPAGPLPDWVAFSTARCSRPFHLHGQGERGLPCCPPPPPRAQPDGRSPLLLQSPWFHPPLPAPASWGCTPRPPVSVHTTAWGRTSVPTPTPKPGLSTWVSKLLFTAGRPKPARVDTLQITCQVPFLNVLHEVRLRFHPTSLPVVTGGTATLAEPHPGLSTLFSQSAWPRASRGLPVAPLLAQQVTGAATRLLFSQPIAQAAGAASHREECGALGTKSKLRQRGPLAPPVTSPSTPTGLGDTDAHAAPCATSTSVSARM